MKREITWGATPLEKNPEYVVSGLVVGLACLIFVCHAGATLLGGSPNPEMAALAADGMSALPEELGHSGAFSLGSGETPLSSGVLSVSAFLSPARRTALEHQEVLAAGRRTLQGVGGFERTTIGRPAHSSATLHFAPAPTPSSAALPAADTDMIRPVY